MDPETKGERARQILENEVYQEATQNAKKRIKDEWAMTEDADERERLWHTHRAINAVTRELKALEGAGVKSRHDRERRQNRKETQGA